MVSTTMYLRCRDHSPCLYSDEVGQHTYDLDDIKGYIANRESLVDVYESYWLGGPSFFRNAAHFLAEHPFCQIGINDEYGKEYPVD